jgi:plasmid stability protein
MMLKIHQMHDASKKAQQPVLNGLERLLRMPSDGHTGPATRGGAIRGTVQPMTKTTVYLPEELKQALTRIAASSGRSEAELIREAIRALVRGTDRPRPRGPLFESGDSTLSAQAQTALAGFGER